jgi:hypothetical protein
MIGVYSLLYSKFKLSGVVVGKFVFLFFIMFFQSACFSDGLSFQGNDSKLNVYLGKFETVSCDITGNLCIAVGYEKDPQGPARLVYKSQDAGLTWSTPVTLTPSPKETIADDKSTTTSISCDSSAQRCVIVSSAVFEKNEPAPVVYNTQDGGQTWNGPIVLPLPKASKKLLGGYIYSNVSCSYSGFSCVIAGTLRYYNETIPLLYTTKDAGYKWTMTSNLKDAARTHTNGTSLQNVSCDNSGFSCVAVGYAMTRDSFWSSRFSSKPVIYTTEDGGAHWKDPIVLPSEIADNKVSTLNDVACSGSGLQCTVMGYTEDYEKDLYQSFSFTTANGGLEWDKQNFIFPNYLSSRLLSLDCDDTGVNCTTVGYYRTINSGPIVFRPIIYSTANSALKWEKNTEISLPAFSYLTDIFCSKFANSCVAVGMQIDSNTSLIAQKTDRTIPYRFQIKPPKATRKKGGKSTFDIT